jgi:hypothetical protein
MIDEQTLSGLLAEHAERIPVPQSGMDALLAASPTPIRAPTRRFSPTTRAVATAASVVIAAAGIWAFTARSGNGPTAVRTVAPGLPRRSAPTTMSPQASGPPSGGGINNYSTVDSARRLCLSDLQAQRPANTTNLTAADSLPLDQRTATLDLLVGRNHLGDTIGRIATIAASVGGYVADAHTEASRTTRAGTVTIRVPSSRFGPTDDRLRGLGTVMGSGARNLELGSPYTALQGRVHQRDDQRRDQTVYATITISLTEPAP